MRNVRRIFGIATAFRILWDATPDLRFFQLIDLISGKVREYEGMPPDADLYHYEDDNLEGHLYRIISEIKTRS